MALTTAQGSAAYLNRAFNDANPSSSVFTTTVADLTANEVEAANKFDVGVATLTDAALAKQVLTNMGLLPTTNASIAALEPALADYFATTGKDNRGFVVLQLARILADKTGDATYGTAAAAWNTEVNNAVASATGALTTSTTDNLSGSASDDTFTASISDLFTSSTLNATDKISGGAGNDVLNITIGQAWTGMNAGAVTGVEKVTLTASDTNALSFDAAGITGATEFGVTSTTGALNLTRVNSGIKTLTLSGLKGATTTTTQAFTMGMVADAAEATGTSDALTLNLNGVGNSSTYRTTLTLNNFETVNAVATGNNYVAFASTDLTKLTSSGAGVFTVSSVNSGLTSFDSSAATGNVTATLSAVTSANTLSSIKTGSGTDGVTILRSGVAGNAVISGGAGTDTLTLRSSSSGSAEYNMTGFETLALSTVTGGAITLSGSKTTDLKTITTTESTSSITGTYSNVTLVNMGSGDLTFTSTGTSAANTITSDHTGATTLNMNATTAYDSTTAAAAPAADYTFSHAAGKLTVAVGQYVNTDTTTISAPLAGSLQLDVSSSKDAANTELSVFDSSITADVATSAVLNITGKLGTGAVISTPLATTGTVVNGSVSGVLQLSAPAMTSLTSTSSATLDYTGSTATSTLTALETLTATATSGTTTFGNLASANKVTLAGTGTSSKVVLASVGANNSYDLTVTATGLKASTTVATPTNGLTITDLTVGTGYNINLDVTGVTSGVSIANRIGDNLAGGTTAVAKDITIKAAGLGGTLDMTGGVIGTGTVSIDAKGAKGLSMGTAKVQGTAVTIDGSGTTAVSTVTNTIDVKSSLNLTTHELAAAQTYTIGAVTGSTAMALTLTGGLDADTIIVNSGLAVANITLTGNLGAGTDSITVNGNYLNANTAKTVSLDGITNYDSSTITTGSGADTIVGGAGVDTIMGGIGGDTLTGGAGADIFWFNATDSTYDAPDTIIDLKNIDTIKFGFTESDALAAETASTDTSTSAAKIDAYGVATFANVTTSTSTLALKVTAINARTTTGETAYFTHGGDTYLFADTGGSTTSALVIKLTGVALPTLAADVLDIQTTGFNGIGG